MLNFIYIIVIWCSKCLVTIRSCIKPILMTLYKKNYLCTVLIIKIIISYFVLKLYNLLYYFLIVICFLKLYYEGRKEYKPFLIEIITIAVLIYVITVLYYYTILFLIFTMTYLLYRLYSFRSIYNHKLTFLVNFDNYISTKMFKKQKVVQLTINKYLK